MAGAAAAAVQGLAVLPLWHFNLGSGWEPNSSQTRTKLFPLEL